MSDNQNNTSLWDKAIEEGPTSSAFDITRKLTACVLAEANSDMSGVEVAGHADRSLFEKAVAFMVNIGKITVEEGVDSLIDRAHAFLAVFVEKALPVLLVAGCGVAGGFIGSYFFANPILGAKIGTTIGTLLSKPVREAIIWGLKKIQEFAHSMWARIKEWILGEPQKVRHSVVSTNKASLA